MRNSKLKLFWWSEIHLMNKSKENFGDLVGKYLVEKISGQQAVFTHPKKQQWKHFLTPVYVTAGSILAHVNKNCIVWGSGIINKNEVVKSAKFLSIRGPQTRERLLEQGYQVPEKYGDPALLLPKYYHPEIKTKYTYGIIPHYVDHKKVFQIFDSYADVKVINLMTNSVEDTIDQFLQCKYIISSSLHGLIVAHAYEIPAIWMKFSNKLFGDNIKFQDYFESVSILSYVALNPEIDLSEIDFDSVKALPQPQRIEKCQNDLLASCPFV